MSETVAELPVGSDNDSAAASDSVTGNVVVASDGSDRVLLYRKERDAAVEELKVKDKELITARSRNYDLLKRVEQLEHQV